MDCFSDLMLVHAGRFSGYRPQLLREVPCHALKFLRKGRGYFGVAGAEVVQLEAPALFWQQPGVVYQWGPAEGGWCVDYVKFTGSAADKLFAGGFNAISPDGCIPVSAACHAATSITDAKRKLEADPVESSAWLRIFLDTVLLELYHRKKRSVLKSGSRGQLYRIMEEIRNAPQQEYCFQEIAKETGVSYSHFRRRFRELTGRPPQDFLIQCRIRMACRLLLSGNRPVKQIAAATGYRDLVYFGRIFKKQMQISPAAYREEFGRE